MGLLTMELVVVVIRQLVDLEIYENDWISCEELKIINLPPGSGGAAL